MKLRMMGYTHSKNKLMYRKKVPIKYIDNKGELQMKTKIYHIKFEGRFATLTEEEYKKLVLKGKKITVLYVK